MGQADVWLRRVLYNTLPIPLVAALLFALFWMVHARALKAGGGRLRDMPGYGTASTTLIGLFSFLLASVVVQTRTIMQFVGSRQDQPNDWRDPAFGQPLHFYFFDLPFVQMMLGLAFVVVIGVAVAYLVASRTAMIKQRFEQAREGVADLADLRLGELFDGGFLRYAIPAAFLLRAAQAYFSRYELVYSDHGLLVGVDWVDENIRLPLIWMLTAACVLGAALFYFRQRMLAFGAVIVVQIAMVILPPIVNATYVKPTEISIQKPYIQRHIEATRSAYGIKDNVKEVEYAVKEGAKLASADTQTLLENVRLWDWGAFHDTITQIQSLRPYYVFANTDVDRYWLPGRDGKKRIQQMMITPREIDVNRVPEARSRWNNPHFVYTHGYGVVAAGTSQITSDGLPELLIKNAPPEIKAPSLKITRPGIYYGEATHEPVFVRTGQPEFDYPAGNENVHSKYEGRGGIPIGSSLMRFVAAVSQSEWNIMFTQFMTEESRMMIRRRVDERLEELAPFVRWDGDPYMVITDEGRLVWMVDGFTQTNLHPYSKSIRRTWGPINYLRNSVKATVDAYDGTVHMYVWDEHDPLLRAYRHLFPSLFEARSKMPADLRLHARYPQRLFRIQAELYRTYHMKDPESFYNKEDVWDVALETASQDGSPGQADPTFIVATLPGEKEPEFVLTVPFTPRTKQNLIGLMLARCDGDKLGEFVVLQLSKQELIFGPQQIKARINQDQNISKDLTLWNQQGSKVIRGQMQVLPVDHTFLYVEPIYLQADQAPMPQLKKVAVALGNQLGYADRYEQALAQVGAMVNDTTVPAASGASGASAAAMAKATPSDSKKDESKPMSTDRLATVRGHMRRYRELMAQGKWSEAGRELEAIESALK
jgi:uncharacterized protein